VVAATVGEDLGARGVVAAEEEVIVTRPADVIYAGEGVVADMGVVGNRAVTGASQDIDGYRSVGEVVVDPRAAVAGDRIVALHAFEAVEGASATSVGAAAAKSGRIVDVVELRAANELDRSQRIGPDRGIAGHRAGGQVYGNAASDAAWIKQTGIAD